MTGTPSQPSPIPDGAVVVAVDGSATADRAVTWATRYATVEHQPLVVAHAIAPITPDAAGLAFDAGATFALVHEQLTADGEALVAEVAAKVADMAPTLQVTTVAEHHDARQLLLRLAERASVVVMGTSGRGALRSLLLGSVAAGVVGRAHCPVVVVPAEETD